MLKDRIAKFRTYFQPFDVRHGLICAPGQAGCLIYGLITHDTLTAAIAAGTAFSIGMGLRRYRQARSLAGAVALMAVAALIGSLTAGQFAVYLGLAAMFAAACASLALIDEDIWWVSLESTIALLLSSQFPSGTDEAIHRAIIVVIAGGFQMVLILILDRLVPRSEPKAEPQTPIPPTKRALTTYGLIAGVSVATAIAAAHWLHLDRAYWAGMTALIILKPRFQLTQQRGFERLLGNVVGCSLATALTFVLPQNGWIDLVLCVGGAAASYGLLRARYAAFSLAVSFTAVMLLYAAHVSALHGSEQRVLATLLGGLISIAVMWLASKTIARHFAI